MFTLDRSQMVSVKDDLFIRSHGTQFPTYYKERPGLDPYRQYGYQVLHEWFLDKIHLNRSYVNIT